MRRAVLALALAVTPIAASAEPRWMTLPPTPPPVPGETTGHAAVDGIDLYYATIGKGPPVVFLHGGLANSDYWGNQVRALMGHHQVILVDSRGHGRSTRDARPFGYDLMADDVVGLLDTLKIDRADIVGWSDGGILGLDLAIRHPQRVRKVFAFAANSVTSGVEPDVAKNPTFARLCRALVLCPPYTTRSQLRIPQKRALGQPCAMREGRLLGSHHQCQGER